MSLRTDSAPAAFPRLLPQPSLDTATSGHGLTPFDYNLFDPTDRGGWACSFTIHTCLPLEPLQYHRPTCTLTTNRRLNVN